MSDVLTAIEDSVAALLLPLDHAAIEKPLIEEKVRMIAPTHNVNSEEDIHYIVRKLEERFDIRMSVGTMFSAEDYRPWLADARGDIDWYYWNRYKRLLSQERLPPQVIRSLDSITDQILDHLEKPDKEGKWSRKGMVVGHVQSGKTGNYIGLICKAADSGYRVIIVLAGILNSLRNQTQARLDSGFIGYCTKLKTLLGAGLINKSKRPVYFTTSLEDFNMAVANQIGVGIEALKDPVVLVIKKNVRTLDNLTNWLQENNPHNLNAFPMLLVDDEADHASINTNKGGDEPTTINRKIRNILHLFDRSSYLGYTATPFANVFIDPETDDKMLGDDLFPRDFIISLDPPSNYVGPHQIFSDESDLNIVRVVDDYENSLPLRHKINWQPDELPLSLKEAIGMFILSRAIKLLRGQNNKHNTMMINVSRFTAVQTNIKLLVDDCLKEIRQAILNYFMLDESESLKNSVMANMKAIWEKELSGLEHGWFSIQRRLKEAVAPIEVIEVNSSASAEPLDYSEQNYPNGRNVIAVGGLSLSRGLTLEGLTLSYFLRNSIMYDTLMQMGRWFGYRDGYKDLCRIYMTAEAVSWYSHIADAMEELRDEFRRMKSAGMSPIDFGLCVRSHPESLIVTARNKMRTGTKVLRKVSLEGRLIESSVLYKEKNIVNRNLQSLSIMVSDADQYGKKDHSNPGLYLWKNVPAEYILKFIGSFRNHPASTLTERLPLEDYINWLTTKDRRLWDVVLVGLKKESQSSIVASVAKINLITQKRSVEYTDDRIVFSKRRVGSRGLEKAGLTEEEIKMAEEGYGGKNIPDYAYRIVRKKPLIMLHIIDCETASNESLFAKGIAAWGISFPGTAGSRRPEKLVEYVVNTTWWKKEYLDLLEEDGEA